MNIKDSNSFLALILCISIFLLIISIFSYLINSNSIEGVVSSLRIVIEVSLVILVVKYRVISSNFFVKFVVYLSVLNSIIVIFQVFESLGLIKTTFNSLNDYWGIREEMMRKPGFFNSILTSSYVIFLGLMLNFTYKLKYARYLWIIQFIALFFSARTFLLPCLFLIPFFIMTKDDYKKTLLKVVFFVLFLLIILPSLMQNLSVFTFYDDLVIHYKDRILPAINVLFSGDLTSDYSSADLMTHYRIPTFYEFVIGNGQPRYSHLGGLDPTYTRWLLQVGFLGLLSVFLIHLVILVYCLKSRNIQNISLGVVLFITPFKGELTTSTLLFSITLLYISLEVKRSIKYK